MFVSEVASTPFTSAPAGGKGKNSAFRLIGAVLGQWNRHRALLAWNRNLMRPACCAHLPSRVWCRHSALLTLRAGGPLR